MVLIHSSARYINSGFSKSYCHTIAKSHVPRWNHRHDARRCPSQTVQLHPRRHQTSFPSYSTQTLETTPNYKPTHTVWNVCNDTNYTTHSDPMDRQFKAITFFQNTHYFSLATTWKLWTWIERQIPLWKSFSMFFIYALSSQTATTLIHDHAEGETQTQGSQCARQYDLHTM